MMGVLSVGAMIGLAYLGWLFRYRQKLGKHIGMSKADFIAHFVREGIPNSIPATAYDLYSGTAFTGAFQPSPDINFQKVLDDDAEEVQDRMLEMLTLLHINRPSQDALSDWHGGRVQTMSDLIKWVFWASELPSA